MDIFKSLYIVCVMGVWVSAIYPKAAFLPNKSRGKAILYWVGATLVSLIILSIASTPDEVQPPIGTLEALIILFVTIVWPITAVVMLVRSKNAAATTKPTGFNRGFDIETVAEAILADDEVNQKEAEFLHDLILKNGIDPSDEQLKKLFRALSESLADGVLDDKEAEEIKSILSEICDKAYSFPKKQKRTAPSKSKKPKPRQSQSETPVFTPSQSLDSDIYNVDAGDHIGFTYVDSRGDMTDREVIFRKYEFKNGYGYIKGICTDRHAHRTFRADRISGLCYAMTGESIEL